MVELLWGQTLDLSNGNFRGVNGAPSRTIVGAKGIGKSTIFRSFTDVCTVMFPSVVCVLINYAKFGRRGDPASAGGLTDVIEKNLLARGFLDEPLDSPLIEDLVPVLDRKKLRLLILVDEIDDLYRKGAATEALKQTTIDILSDLASLGDQVTGLFSTFLCGSSSNIPMLISKNAFADMKDEFPVLEFSPNLNGTKFRDVHIPSSTPTMIENVPELLNQPTLIKEACRVVAFFAGTTPRNVQIASQSRSAPGQLDVLCADESYLGTNTLANDRLKKFVDIIQRALLAKNKGLIDKFYVKDAFDHKMVLTTEWETEFKPCTFDEIKALHFKEGLAQDSPKAIYNDLFRLHYASWIILEGVEAAAPKHIFPVALFQLIKLDIALVHRNSAKTFFVKALNGIFTKGKEVTLTDLADSVVGVLDLALAV